MTTRPRVLFLSDVVGLPLRLPFLPILSDPKQTRFEVPIPRDVFRVRKGTDRGGLPRVQPRNPIHLPLFETDHMGWGLEPHQGSRTKESHGAGFKQHPIPSRGWKERERVGGNRRGSTHTRSIPSGDGKGTRTNHHHETDGDNGVEECPPFRSQGREEAQEPNPKRGAFRNPRTRHVGPWLPPRGGNATSIFPGRRNLDPVPSHDAADFRRDYPLVPIRSPMGPVQTCTGNKTTGKGRTDRVTIGWKGGNRTFSPWIDEGNEEGSHPPDPIPSIDRPIPKRDPNRPFHAHDSIHTNCILTSIPHARILEPNGVGKQ